MNLAHLFHEEKGLLLVHQGQGTQCLFSCLINLIDHIVHLVLQVIMRNVFIAVLHDTDIFVKVMQNLFAIHINIQGCVMPA